MHKSHIGNRLPAACYSVYECSGGKDGFSMRRLATTTRILGAVVMAVALASCSAISDRGGGRLSSVEVANLLGPEITAGPGGYYVGTLLSPYHKTGVDELLDAADQRLAQDTAHTSLETSPDNRATSWSNPNSGHGGTFTPLNIYTSGDNLPCRDYELRITVSGQTKDTYGAACRLDDGAWRVVETPIRRSLRHGSAL